MVADTGLGEVMGSMRDHVRYTTPTAVVPPSAVRLERTLLLLLLQLVEVVTRCLVRGRLQRLLKQPARARLPLLRLLLLWVRRVMARQLVIKVKVKVKGRVKVKGPSRAQA